MTTLTALITDLSSCPLSLRERVGVREAASTSPLLWQLAASAFKDRAGGHPHPNPLPEGEGVFGHSSCTGGNLVKARPAWRSA